MRVYDQVKDVMCDEIAQMIRRPLDPNSVHTIGEMVDIVKDIHEINENEQGYSFGNNSYGNSYQGNMNKYGFYPMYGYSFERGQNASRNSQGQYMDGNSMGGYYAGGSNTKEELRKLMERATNETEKEAIRVAMESMNN